MNCVTHFTAGLAYASLIWPYWWVWRTLLLFYYDHLAGLAYASVMYYQLLLIKEVGSARQRESDVHPISPKTPAPQYQSIDRKMRKGKKE